MIGKMFITRSGYDPQYGNYVKDPYLGDTPSLGACRPDIRRQLRTGDHIFVISGRIPDKPQFVMGGFEVEAKMPAVEAYRRYREQRLHRLPDGQLAGNIIVNARGKQHKLDNHGGFVNRIRDYVVGRNCLALVTPREIEMGRAETMEVLCEIFKKRATKPIEIVTHFGAKLDEGQIVRLRDWLSSLKKKA